MGIHGNPGSGLGVSGYERFGVLEKQQLIALQKYARQFEQQPYEMRYDVCYRLEVTPGKYHLYNSILYILYDSYEYHMTYDLTLMVPGTPLTWPHLLSGLILS